jgi:hypothetical protein
MKYSDDLSDARGSGLRYSKNFVLLVTQASGLRYSKNIVLLVIRASRPSSFIIAHLFCDDQFKHRAHVPAVCRAEVPGQAGPIPSHCPDPYRVNARGLTPCGSRIPVSYKKGWCQTGNCYGSGGFFTGGAGVKYFFVLMQMSCTMTWTRINGCMVWMARIQNMNTSRTVANKTK